MQSRYYNPKIGRFISKDTPIFHEGLSGAEANLYAYCNNNPVMGSDPTGLYKVDNSVKHWWGVTSYLSYNAAKDFIHDLGQIITALTTFGTASAAILTAAFGPFGIGVGAGLTIIGGTIKLIRDDAQYKNEKTKKGIVVNWWYTLFGTTIKCR